MKKTTLYLPDDLKREVERAARTEGRSEADVIRDAIASSLSSRAPEPRVPLVAKGLGDPTIAARTNELLDGFGS
jgi:predicted transcriptional regulator